MKYLGSPYIDLILSEAGSKADYCHRQGKVVNPSPGYGKPPCVTKSDTERVSYSKKYASAYSRTPSQSLSAHKGKIDAEDQELEYDGMDDEEEDVEERKYRGGDDQQYKDFAPDYEDENEPEMNRIKEWDEVEDYIVQDALEYYKKIAEDSIDEISRTDFNNNYSELLNKIGAQSMGKYLKDIIAGKGNWGYDEKKKAQSRLAALRQKHGSHIGK